jgi:hypothetical protein
MMTTTSRQQRWQVRKNIVTSRYATSKQAKEELDGLVLLYGDAPRLNIKFQPRENASFYTSEGEFIALFLVDIFDEEEQAERAAAFANVKGDLRNRPEIIGRHARQELTRADGTRCDYIGSSAPLHKGEFYTTITPPSERSQSN